MLAQPGDLLPAGRGWAFEPKWDGVRAVVVTSERVRVWSRRGTDMTASFPDVVAAVSAQVGPGTVLDGELVVWSAGRLDFTAVMSRIASGPAAAARKAHELPASLAVFDVLAADGRDVRAQPWQVRRRVLEDLALGWVPPLNLTPATTDPAVAAGWLVELAVAGVEGVVAKPVAGRYAPGGRGWVKVKHRRTVDVVAGAVIGPVTAPRAVVVGVPGPDGRLGVAGRSTDLGVPASRELAGHLRAPAGPHPWPPVLAGGVAGWGRDPVRVTLVEPVVVEVSADVAWTGRVFRHPVRFVRARPDVDVTGP